MTNETPLCWICRTRPANSAEHRFKASDIRQRVPTLTPQAPIYLQRGSATNQPVGSAKSRALTFKPSICTQCNNAATQRYDVAWETLSKYLRSNWPGIVRRGRFDLSKPFPGSSRKSALYVHLFFVKLFGCKVAEEKAPIDLTALSRALLAETPHPEIVLQIADCDPSGGLAVAYETELNTMRDRSSGEIHGVTWGYLIHPVAVKVSWIKAGAPLHTPGWEWHPSAPGKVVKLGPYMGTTEPTAGPKAIIEDEEAPE
jgi:hypothetical protein